MNRKWAVRMMLAASSLVPVGAAAEDLDRDKQDLAPVQLVAETSVVTPAEAAAHRIPAPFETSEGAAGSDWNVSFTPYLWVAGIHGDITIPRNDSEVEVDRSFADILTNLDFAFMGAFDVEHNRFVMVGDIMYLNLGVEAEAVNNPGFTGEADTKTFVGTALVGYRIVDKGPLFVDLLAGGRLASVDVEFSLTGPQGQTIQRSVSPSKLAPLVGGRVQIPLSSNWGLGLYGDFGGLTDSSEVRWQLIGSIHYDISSHWRLVTGYRHMQLKHDETDADYDFSLGGPFLAVSYLF